MNELDTTAHAISAVERVLVNGGLNSIPSRQSIERFEAELLKHPQAAIPVTHYFADGGKMYARKITIPPDCWMTGMVHKREHISVLLRGEMTCLTPDGMQRIVGPKVMVAPPGTKRVGVAHTETEWLTVHLTSGETDIEKLEAELVESSSVVMLPSQRARELEIEA